MVNDNTLGNNRLPVDNSLDNKVHPYVMLPPEHQTMYNAAYETALRGYLWEEGTIDQAMEKFSGLDTNQLRNPTVGLAIKAAEVKAAEIIKERTAVSHLGDKPFDEFFDKTLPAMMARDLERMGVILDGYKFPRR